MPENNQEQLNSQPIIIDEVKTLDQPVTLKTTVLSDFNGQSITIGDKIYTFNSANTNYKQYLSIKSLRLVGVNLDEDNKPKPESMIVLMNNIEIMKCESAKMFWNLPSDFDWGSITIEQGLELIKPISETDFLAQLMR